MNKKLFYWIGLGVVVLALAILATIFISGRETGTAAFRLSANGGGQAGTCYTDYFGRTSHGVTSQSACSGAWTAFCKTGQPFGSSACSYNQSQSWPQGSCITNTGGFYRQLIAPSCFTRYTGGEIWEHFCAGSDCVVNTQLADHPYGWCFTQQSSGVDTRAGCRAKYASGGEQLQWCNLPLGNNTCYPAPNFGL